ncbi:beta/gamma crystallin-related protein [Maricaulis salignorans]|uniref:Beta/Gamma crystallin n=1 Tax=Maricaulis salignorans TaxID=144026 RepID=A0A1G9U850_9PROT|nr:beta/gamma crystallin-related protein [Maricaulis salignorans]SDM55854.1 Beta/Gamma crystallin [Maricaulis salignorans]
MKIRYRLTAMAALLLAGATGAASAQEIILFDQPNFQGQSLTINRATSDLSAMRFNDRTSSFRIVSGQWEFCVDSNYSGGCFTYTSSEAHLGRYDNLYTGVRPVAPTQTNPGRPGRGNSLTLYSGPNFSGRAVVVTDSQSDLSRLGFNDATQSIRYSGRGSWRVCDDSNFRAACMQVNGDLPTIPGGLAGRISSVEPDYNGNPGGPRPGGPGGNYGPQPRNGVWLFDGADFTGQRVDVQQDTTTLERVGFNDRADSLAVARGETWQVCEHADYRGRCEYFEGDSVEDLTRYYLRNTISSLRRVDGAYGHPGNGYPGPGGGNGYPGPDSDRGMNVRGGVRGVDAAFFARPEVNGMGIDRCLGEGGRFCDEEVARRVCRSAGYSRAAHFSVDRYSRSRTWFIGANQECRAGRCEPMVDLLCTN